MKIIVSHDVDHLYRTDHLTDLFYPKLWVRESRNLLHRRITAKEWALRMALPFHRELNHLTEVMHFDKENGVPSTFFFGMGKGLGMSYGGKRAVGAIRRVRTEGFSTGVHGIAFDDADAIQAEFDAYRELTGMVPRGIRMHYVRRSERTLQMLSEAGYAFDSTMFDSKTEACIQAPYQVNGMWEFPLMIMDSYLPYDAGKARKKTIDILRKAEERGTGYCTVLLHDTNFTDAYAVYRDWYQWFIRYCRQMGYGFTSFFTAIQELECVRSNEI